MYNTAKIALVEYLKQVEQDEFTARCHLFGNGAVASLENKLKNFYGVKHVLCVDSATNGLLYLALATGLKNSEIVTSPLSYGATISGTLWLNNKFHFVEIDNTLNIAPEAVRKILQENPRIKALYAVDFAGIPHDMFAVRQICDEFGVWYFADAAQSLGAEINGLKASSLADAFVISFSPGKTIFCGEGACILTDNTDLYKRLVTVTQHPYRIKKDVCIAASSELGLNGRINPLAAIVGNAIFDDCMQNLKRKQAVYMKLYDMLDHFHSVIPFHFAERKFLPAFYHLPVLASNMQGFEQELSSYSKKYRVENASFELLSEQLQRIGKKRAVKYHKFPLTDTLTKQLILLYKINHLDLP
jgi:dTDP-4-amino-4,6-dideoxygalactose transaminase